MKKYINILVYERLELVGIRDMTHTCAIVAMCWAGMQVTVRKTVYKHWMWKWRRNILPPLWPTANCSPPPPHFHDLMGCRFDLNVDCTPFISPCMLSTTFRGLHSKAAALSAIPMRSETADPSFQSAHAIPLDGCQSQQIPLSLVCDCPITAYKYIIL